jgi:glucokinase
VDAQSLAQKLAVPRVALINDLVATGHGVEALAPGDLTVIQPGKPAPDANAGILAPGTGLGQSILVRAGGRYLPVPSEAGHADFAPRTDAELKVFRALRTRFGRVSCERILSGPGLASVGEIVHAGRGAQAAWDRHVADAPGTTLPSAVTRHAIERSCDGCVEALNLFVGVLGAEAGNLALRAVTLGGIYLGGGITPKIIAALKSATFTEAFRDKGPMRGLLASVPIWVIRNERTAVLGAARFAAAALN